MKSHTLAPPCEGTMQKYGIKRRDEGRESEKVVIYALILSIKY